MYVVTRTTSCCGSSARPSSWPARGADERDRNRRLDTGARKTITGLADGESLIGVDSGPPNGLLYGVGRIGADPASLGQLYTIDVDSGLATAVGLRLIPLNGNAFGVDFNPVPDLLRIVSDLGQNIRVRPLDGAVAGTDTNLAYPALGDPNSARTPRVVAVAYTNPDADLQTNTVLHDLDVDRAADVRSGPRRRRAGDPGLRPMPAPSTPRAGLGIDADDLAAFDIGPYTSYSPRSCRSGRNSRASISSISRPAMRPISDGSAREN